jgi:23S rRNA-/tRNA-specific pseudouridylate synthase
MRRRGLRTGPPSQDRRARAQPGRGFLFLTQSPLVTTEYAGFMAKLTLDRILQSQGVGTRKYCRQLIDDGEVAIGGLAVTDYRATPPTDDLVFTLFGEEWTYRARLYIALNKPVDFECSRKPSHHPGVLTILPEQFGWRDLQPVGRLDHDTTGLLPSRRRSDIFRRCIGPPRTTR